MENIMKLAVFSSQLTFRRPNCRTQRLTKPITKQTCVKKIIRELSTLWPRQTENHNTLGLSEAEHFLSAQSVSSAPSVCVGLNSSWPSSSSSLSWRGVDGSWPFWAAISLGLLTKLLLSDDGKVNPNVVLKNEKYIEFSSQTVKRVSPLLLLLSNLKVWASL